MADINKTILAGNLGDVGTVSRKDTGWMARMRVGTRRRGASASTWCTVVYWFSSDDEARYLEAALVRGARVYVEGSVEELRSGDGQGTSTFVKADSLQVEQVAHVTPNRQDGTHPQSHSQEQLASLHERRPLRPARPAAGAVVQQQRHPVAPARPAAPAPAQAERPVIQF